MRQFGPNRESAWEQKPKGRFFFRATGHGQEQIESVFHTGENGNDKKE
jgi:hypothetical protein